MMGVYLNKSYLKAFIDFRSRLIPIIKLRIVKRAEIISRQFSEIANRLDLFDR